MVRRSLLIVFGLAFVLGGAPGTGSRGVGTPGIWTPEIGSPVVWAGEDEPETMQWHFEGYARIIEAAAEANKGRRLLLGLSGSPT